MSRIHSSDCKYPYFFIRAGISNTPLVLLDDQAIADATHVIRIAQERMARNLQMHRRFQVRYGEIVGLFRREADRLLIRYTQTDLNRYFECALKNDIERFNGIIADDSVAAFRPLIAIAISEIIGHDVLSLSIVFLAFFRMITQFLEHRDGPMTDSTLGNTFDITNDLMNMASIIQSECWYSDAWIDGILKQVYDKFSRGPLDSEYKLIFYCTFYRFRPRFRLGFLPEIRQAHEERKLIGELVQKINLSVEAKCKSSTIESALAPLNGYSNILWFVSSTFGMERLLQFYFAEALVQISASKFTLPIVSVIIENGLHVRVLLFKEKMLLDAIIETVHPVIDFPERENGAVKAISQLITALKASKNLSHVQQSGVLSRVRSAIPHVYLRFIPDELWM
jgi:hypothetical protein